MLLDSMVHKTCPLFFLEDELFLLLLRFFFCLQIFIQADGRALLNLLEGLHSSFLAFPSFDSFFWDLIRLYTPGPCQAQFYLVFTWTWRRLAPVDSFVKHKELRSIFGHGKHFHFRLVLALWAVRCWTWFFWS